MKRIALLVSSLLLLLTACDITSLPYPPGEDGISPHWRRTEAQVTLWVVLDPSAEVLRPTITNAKSRWSKAQYVELRYADTCKYGASCIFVYGEKLNGGNTGFCTECEHIPVATVKLDNTTPIDSQRLAVTCVELGHALGLTYNPPHQMCGGVGQPTAWDIALVDALHAERHVT